MSEELGMHWQQTGWEQARKQGAVTASSKINFPLGKAVAFQKLEETFGNGI